MQNKFPAKFTMYLLCVLCGIHLYSQIMQKKIQSALISVFYKDGLEVIIHELNRLDITIYSTGGTQEFIEKLGVACVPVESLTSYPSILGGRVKTLHPKVFGGILGKRNDGVHVAEMKEHDISQIDLVIVDLYPFEETVATVNSSVLQDGDGEKLISNATKAFTHTYAEPGTYAVQLVAEDKATGCTNTATQKVVIEKPSVVATADVNLSTEPKTVTAENLPTVDILLEKRISNLVRQIEVVNDSVQVSFYDNGEIDGDSITVSYNNKIITQHLLLTANGKTFTIKVEPAPAQNELIMYAENLGSIPPNTAIMIIYDGKARYEVNISSNNESNGKVSFTLKQ